MPDLINRLECLKLIHEESAGISEKIQNLKENEKKINNALEESSSLLRQVNIALFGNRLTISKVGETLNENLPKIINDINELQKKL